MLILPSLERKGLRIDVTVNKELYWFKVKLNYLKYDCEVKCDASISEDYISATISNDLKHVVFCEPVTLNNKAFTKILISKSKKHLFTDNFK